MHFFSHEFLSGLPTPLGPWYELVLPILSTGDSVAFGVLFGLLAAHCFGFVGCAAVTRRPSTWLALWRGGDERGSSLLRLSTLYGLLYVVLPVGITAFADRTLNPALLLGVQAVLGFLVGFMLVDRTESLLRRWGRWLPNLLAPFFWIASRDRDMNGRAIWRELLEHRAVRRSPLLRRLFVTSHPWLSLPDLLRYPDLGDVRRTIQEVVRDDPRRVVDELQWALDDPFSEADGFRIDGDDLLPLLTHDDPDVREVAIRACARVGGPDQDPTASPPASLALEGAS